MSPFLSEEASIIGGKSIESTLYRIDTAVDKTFDSQDKVYADEDGKLQDNKQIKKFIKSRLAFQMSQNLPIECKDLKPYLLKHTAELMNTPNQNFIKFIDTVCTEAERLQRSEEFRNVKLPTTSKKGLHILSLIHI